MKRLAFVAAALLAMPAMAEDEDPYIKSLGTSGISTGYRMKGGISRVEVDFALTATAGSGQMRIFGDTSKETTLGTMFYFTGSGTSVGDSHTFRVRGRPNMTSTDTSLNGDSQWVKAADTARKTLVTDLKNGFNQLIDGDPNNYKAFNASLFAGLVADLPLSLFANYGNARATAFVNGAQAKIYGVKIYENYDDMAEDNSSKLVHDFVPCKKDDGTPCFKDMVGGGFIVPEDPSAFVASADAPTYQDDAYVSTAANANGGKLYIDTGYVIGDNTCVALDCAMAGDLMNGSYESTTLWYLFDGTPSSGKRFEFNFGALSHAGCLRWSAAGNDFYATTNWWRAAFQPATANNDFRKLRRTYILGGGGGSVRASVVTCGFTNCTVTAAASSTYSGTNTLKIASYFSGKNYNTPLKIYGCKIYESGALVRDFVPYVGYDYATGTAMPGLRDRVTGSFAAGADGANGGNLLAYGGRIEGEQDAYIESNGSDGSGISTGYRMKGAISRVEVDFRFVTPAAQKYIYGTSSANNAESSLQTFLYTTGSGVGDSFKFCQRPYANNGCDTQWAMTPDVNRHTAVTDLKNKKNMMTGLSPESRSFNKSDFAGLTAQLPLSIFGKFSSSAGTSIHACPNARIYSVRFYENYVEGGNNTPVRELIPYSRAGVVGFYDTVSGEIVKNDSAAAGAFTFGGAGMDHGSLKAYIQPLSVSTVKLGGTLTLKAYAPGATSYRWLKDGKPIEDVAGEELSVQWTRGGTQGQKGYLHGYQAIAVYGIYGTTRESAPSATVYVTSLYPGMLLMLK